MRHSKGLSCGVDKVSLERLLRREGHTVQKQIHARSFRFYKIKKLRDVLIPTYITRRDRRIRSKRRRQLFHIFLQTIPLIIKN